MNDWDFKVQGKNAGELLCETVHKGVSSMQIEVSVWLERMKKGECDTVVIADMRPKWRREADGGPWARDFTQTIQRGRPYQSVFP